MLIVGATGRTGRFAVDALLEQGWTVRALVRDPAAAALPAEVELVAGPAHDRPALNEAVAGAQAVLFTATGVGTSPTNKQMVDYEGVARLADAGEHAGVRHFVLLSSASVTQPEHPHNSSFYNVLRWKLKGEQALKTHGFDHTIVRALGLRDRPGGREGLRMVQGDRIAFGEDLARADAGRFLADVVCVGAGMDRTANGGGFGFAPDFDQASLINTTFEVYSDLRITPREWRSARASLLKDAEAT